MKRFLISLFMLLFLLNTSSALGQKKMVEFDKNFSHVVYFWLKNPDSTKDRKAFEASLKKFLRKSKYAQTNFIGVPAKTPREVVDNSYTYSLILTFPSKEVQEKYQEEQAHLAFIEESSPLWKKVLVYDSVGIE
ncbi:MAG: Dabb family protein [Christiangramia sp.]|nr:Dabb family protein [Christiangramia sp.]